MTKTGVTKSELESLKAVGFVEGDKNTIPENINPVLKSKLLRAMGYAGDGYSPNAADGNPTDDQQSAVGKEDRAAKTQNTLNK